MENLRALRRTPRLRMALPARCRSRTGFGDRVVIADLSTRGCRIDSMGLIAHTGDLVVVRPQGLEGLGGVIRWVKGHSAGIEFDQPLYEPVVEHLHRLHGQFLPEKGAARGGMRLAA